MIQLTHLGRRTSWNKDDWLPVVAPSPLREPAHRPFPKEAEDWDIERIVGDYAGAAERMQAAGMDGIEIECLRPSDGPVLVAGHQSRGPTSTAARWTIGFASLEVLDAVRGRSGRISSSACRMAADEDWDKASPRKKGSRSAGG